MIEASDLASNVYYPLVVSVAGSSGLGSWFTVAYAPFVTGDSS